MIGKLTVEQATDMAEAIAYRRKKFTEEILEMSVMVVLLNYGDRFTQVRCVNGEWDGIKNDLEPRDGVPLCPNGHSMIEYGPRYTLGLVRTDG